MLKPYLLLILLILPIEFFGQFAPQAQLSGSTAIPANSAEIKQWAQIIQIQRGYINIADTNQYIDGSNKASYGTINNALGQADDKVISLGDGGSAIIYIPQGLYDGPGWDFVIFENGFRNLNDSNLAFLELAYVEVSTDGQNFIRFPCVSLTEDTAQINTFGWLDARKIHNLAGKYIAGFGVPFDLSDISSQQIDLQNIKYIKITDVIGSINPYYACYDSQGNIINDPYPTPFTSGGFDLDAVGFININNNIPINIFPNPTNDVVNIFSSKKIESIYLLDYQGKIIFKTSPNVNFFKINISKIQSGLYFCIIKTQNKTISRKLIKF